MFGPVKHLKHYDLSCLSFLQVNGTNVVKVGHRQVVSLIRQGGSRLLMKVVSVSRKSETNLIRKKGRATCCPVLVRFDFIGTQQCTVSTMI